MGGHFSSSNNAVVPKILESSIQLWNTDEISSIYERYKEINSPFFMKKKQMLQLFPRNNVQKELVETLSRLFGGNVNKSIKSIEVFIIFALVSRVSPIDKQKYVYRLFLELMDKDGLTMNEFTILIITTLSASKKIDLRVTNADNYWNSTLIERKTKSIFNDLIDQSFEKINKNSIITMEEFIIWCQKDKEVNQFNKYWINKFTPIHLNDHEMWTDKSFPPNLTSIYIDPYNPPIGAPRVIQWKRLKDICENAEPKLFIGTSTRISRPGSGEIVSGILAHHWIGNAFALIQTKPYVLERLFLLTRQEKEGRYCVKLFKEGEWKYIMIDDWIPCDAFGEPLFTHCKDGNTIWPVLLEKAYAKLHGSYEALSYGNMNYCLDDISGGSAKTLNMIFLQDVSLGSTSRTAPRVSLSGSTSTKTDNAKIAIEYNALNDLNLDSAWTALLHLHRSQAVGAVMWKPVQIRDRASHNGILRRHVYTISIMKEITVKPKSGQPHTFRMLYLHNPWRGHESGTRNSNLTWKGDWSEGSRMWKKFKDAKKALDVREECYNSNHTWICFKDFVKVFDTIHTASFRHLSIDWSTYSRPGRWNVKQYSAGGAPGVLGASWRKNQQFGIKILSERTEVLVVLSTVDCRWRSNDSYPKQSRKSIGLIVASHPWNSKTGNQKLPTILKDNVLSYTSKFQKRKCCSLTLHSLSRGEYIILPCTFHPKQEGEFIMTVYTSKPIEIAGQETHWEIDERFIDTDDDLEIELDNTQNDEIFEDEDDIEYIGIKKMYFELNKAMILSERLNRRKEELLDSLASLNRNNQL